MSLKEFLEGQNYIGSTMLGNGNDKRIGADVHVPCISILRVYVYADKVNKI